MHRKRNGSDKVGAKMELCWGCVSSVGHIRRRSFFMWDTVQKRASILACAKKNEKKGCVGTIEKTILSIYLCFRRNHVVFGCLNSVPYGTTINGNKITK